MWVSSLVLTCKSHTVCGRTASIGDSIQFTTCTWMHGVTSEECVNRERPWEGILGLKVTCIFHKLHPKDGFWYQVSICAFYKASVATYMNLCLTVSMAGCLCLFPGSSKWNGWRPRNTKLCNYTSTYLQLVDEKDKRSRKVKTCTWSLTPKTSRQDTYYGA